MTIFSKTEATASEAQIQLLEANDDTVDGYENWKGYPVKRSESGGWRSASFVLGAGSIERFAYYGIQSNLINYLTDQLGEPMAIAAANVNTWEGVVWFLPVFEAFIADSFLGRYRTIIITNILYILGVSLLTLLAILFASSPGIAKSIPSGSNSSSKILFYFALYVVAIAQGYKPCVQAFGADQFDSQHPEESRAKSSFFNWWCWGLSFGGLVAYLTLNYIQDNVNWGLGFGIPCLSMIFGLILLLLGIRTYRFSAKRVDEENPHLSGSQLYTKVGETLHNASSSERIEDEAKEALGIINSHQSSQKYKFADKFLAAIDKAKGTALSCCSNKNYKAKRVIRLLPIWACCLTYALAFAQATTLFTKQATTMGRSIGLNFTIPAASLQLFGSISVLTFIPLYDRIFTPVARMITGKPTGWTLLQRIGIGLAISSVNMVIAALIEKRRLQIAQDYGLVDIPNATIPMSFWWLIPQYMVSGLADVFTLVGMQEFFYDQVGPELRSVGISLYLGDVGVANFLSSFLISFIQSSTSQNGRDGWFANNLNRAHLDYFYWLLAGMGTAGALAFVFFASFYTYVKEKPMEDDS